jgi:hypothetical protein
MPRMTKTGYETSIIGGVLFFEDARQCEVDDAVFRDIIGDGYTKSIRVVSLDRNWIQKTWVTFEASIIEKINVEMTLRREIRSGAGHWYAYRRVHKVLHKRYVGTDEKLNQDLILAVAQRLPSL